MIFQHLEVFDSPHKMTWKEKIKRFHLRFSSFFSSCSERWSTNHHRHYHHKNVTMFYGAKFSWDSSNENRINDQPNDISTYKQFIRFHRLFLYRCRRFFLSHCFGDIEMSWNRIRFDSIHILYFFRFAIFSCPFESMRRQMWCLSASLRKASEVQSTHSNWFSRRFSVRKHSSTIFNLKNKCVMKFMNENGNKIHFELSLCHCGDDWWSLYSLRHVRLFSCCSSFRRHGWDIVRSEMKWRSQRRTE